MKNKNNISCYFKMSICQRIKYFDWKLKHHLKVLEKHSSIFRNVAYDWRKKPDVEYLQRPEQCSDSPYLSFNLVYDNPELPWNFYAVFSKYETSLEDIKRFLVKYPKHRGIEAIVDGIVQNNPNIGEKECQELNSLNLGINFELSPENPNYPLDKNREIVSWTDTLNPNMSRDYYEVMGEHFSEFNPCIVYELLKISPYENPLLYTCRFEYVIKNIYRYKPLDQLYIDGIDMGPVLKKYFQMYMAVASNYTVYKNEASLNLKQRQLYFLKVLNIVSPFSRNIDKILKKRLNYN